MKEKELKEFCSYLSRSYLLEEINTVNKLTPELDNYIKKEMTYENAMLLAFNGPDILTEDSASDKTAGQLRRIRQSEKFINKWIGTPLSIITGLGAGAVAGAFGADTGAEAGFNVAKDKYLSMSPLEKAKAVVTKGQRGIAKDVKAHELKGAGIGALAAGGPAMVVGGITAKAGTWLVSKLLSFLRYKFFNSCKKQTKTKDEYNKCMYKAHQKLIQKIKSEIPKCKDTRKPERCEKKLKDELEDIMEKAKKYN